MAVKGSVLLSGEHLGPGDSLVSPSGRYFVTLHPDGNIVVYLGSPENPIGPMWSTETAGDRSDTLALVMQDDGNLVLYDNAKPIWATNTAKKAGECYASMQDDGNFVLYKGRPVAAGDAFWDTGTYESRIWVHNSGAFVARAKVYYRTGFDRSSDILVGQCRSLTWPAVKDATVHLVRVSWSGGEVDIKECEMGARRAQRYQLTGSQFNPGAHPVNGQGCF